MVDGAKSAVRGARREVAARLAGVCSLPDRDDLDDEVVQAAGEVIANAVTHSRSAGIPGSVVVELESRQRGLLLAVWDLGVRPGAAAPPHTGVGQARVKAFAEAVAAPSPEDVLGFGVGLGVVEACSSEYGYVSGPQGGVMWVTWIDPAHVLVGSGAVLTTID